MQNFSSQDTFYLAPLRGITDWVYRNTYENFFGKFDYLLTPFIPTVKGMAIRRSILKDLEPSRNDINRVIPQMLGKDAHELTILTNAISELGYKKVNWNLGCPHPLVTRKKRGSGLLPYYEEIDSILEYTIPRINCKLSIKCRLGYKVKSDIEKLIPIFNKYPLDEIILHPRTGEQLYDGTCDLDAFEKVITSCKHKIVYNGDITSKDHYSYLKSRFQSISNWMIGRGIIQDPFLLMSIKGNTEINNDRLQRFSQDLLTGYMQLLPTKGHVIDKMKQQWTYLFKRFTVNSSTQKNLLKAKNLDTFEKCTEEVFEELGQGEMYSVK